MRNTEARRVKQSKTNPWYLAELATNVVKSSSSPGGFRCVVGEDRKSHVTNLDPQLGSGAPQDVYTVLMIVQTSDYRARAVTGSRLRLKTTMRAVQERLFVKFECLLERSRDGIPRILILLRRDLASRSSHLLSNLASSADKRSTLVWSSATSSVQVEREVSISPTVHFRATGSWLYLDITPTSPPEAPS